MSTLIREEDKVHEQWYAEAKKQTPETIGPWLAQFLGEEHSYDYGAICHAIAAAAVGVAWAVERAPGARGGITGFQAGAVMWQFIREWDAMGTKGPMRLLQYENLLYPQYEHHWHNIPAESWQWVQDEAQKRLADRGMMGMAASGAVLDHWRRIVDGQVPFGLSIEER